MASTLATRARASTLPSATRTRTWRALVVLTVAALSTVVFAAEPAAADGPACPCSLWSDADVPAVVDWNDDRAVELGVQFTVDIAAPATGLRFYKSAANTGTHTGSLWSTDGTLLARATFTNETESGWQQVSFATPVNLAPGVRYVASYHTPTGHYSADTSYFLGKGRDNGILHAPATSPDALNGLFVYSPVPAFPTGMYNENNYWIDVIVAPRTLTSIAITGAPASLAKGLTGQLQATATYSDGTTADVTGQAAWASSAPSVATVSATGLLQAAGVGSATVTASLDGITGSAPVSVTPATITGLTVSPAATLRPLNVRQLTATATYTDGTTADFTTRARWATSNPAVVLPNCLVPGHVVGLLPGTAVITATVDGRSASATLTVRW